MIAPVRIGRIALCAGELLVISAFVIATRCANYQDVFVGGKIYFTDADCYARMTRVRLCAQHPGLVLRHHVFENFPEGTTPHTTAPFDYLILALATIFRPFSVDATDAAGAFVSPILALLGGWFLWWWGRRMNLRYRWVSLILYAASPILVHATELGRPDHQSLVVVLVTVALCSEWSWRINRTIAWSVATAAAWALAIWVSAYEPLLIFLFVLLVQLLDDRRLLFHSSRRIFWIVFAALLVVCLLVERRLPEFSALTSSAGQNWSRTIGELVSVPLWSSVWFRWAGYLVLMTPILIWLAYRRHLPLPWFVPAVLILTFCLTIWEARWGYFFISVFLMALPALLETVSAPLAVWLAFALSLLPILRDWDERIWPNEYEFARRIEQRREEVELRALSLDLMSPRQQAFLAPWWFSPAIAYWSGQPGIAGSSHESLDGIIDTCRFFLTTDPLSAREILARREVSWVVIYDSDRIIANSAAILGGAPPVRPLGRTLDRTPAQAPHFLTLVSQNGTAKLFQVGNNR